MEQKTDQPQDTDSLAPREDGDGFSGLLDSMAAPESAAERKEDGKAALSAAPSDPADGKGASPEASQDTVKNACTDQPNTIERVRQLTRIILDDLPRSADAAEQSEFAANGSGALGNLFRAIKALPEDDHVEAWSNIIEIASALWDAERSEACLTFAKAAHLNLSTPEIFRDRIESGITRAQDYIFAEKAEQHFERGDGEAAKAFAKQVSRGFRDEYVEEIAIRDKARRRSRGVAIALSGAFILILAGTAIHGALGVRDLLRNPPQVSLPEFPEPAFIDELKQARIVENSPPDLSILLDAEEGDESVEEETPVEDVTSVRDTSPLPATEPNTSPDPSTPSPDNAEEGPSAEVLPVAPGPVEAPTTAPRTDSGTEKAQAIYNCALGQAVSKRAIELVVATGDPTKAAPVEDFVNKVNRACGVLDVSQAEIDKVIAQIPRDQIEQVARNLSGT